MFILPFLHVAFAAAWSVSGPNARHDHSEVLTKRLASSWYQPRDHFAHALFSRADAAVGSAEWSAGYPPAGESDAIGKIPANWKAALDAAVKAGKIPDIPASKVSDSGPSYPGQDGNSKEICSSTVQCRIDGDLWDAPDGVYASSFDDGPLPPTSKLLDFLPQQKLSTTHFMIGSNMLTNVDEFKKVLASEGDLAVHTWSHRYTTSLSNEEIVGELGWTMQIIYKSSGGKLPRFWRPPYGDSDRRVSAIAREVFGMTTVIWNHDSEDWTMDSPGGPSEDKILGNVNEFLSIKDKSPGLMVLEHELSDETVDVFIKSFPNIAGNGWKFMSLADAYGNNSYTTDTKYTSLFGDAASTSGSAASSSSNNQNTTKGSTLISGAASTDGNSSSSSSSDSSSKWGPIIIVLLVANLLVLIVLAVFNVLTYVRKGGRDNSRSLPGNYAPVNLRDDAYSGKQSMSRSEEGYRDEERRYGE